MVHGKEVTLDSVSRVDLPINFLLCGGCIKTAIGTLVNKLLQLCGPLQYAIERSAMIGVKGVCWVRCHCLALFLVLASRVLPRLYHEMHGEAYVIACL